MEKMCIIPRLRQLRVAVSHSGKLSSSEVKTSAYNAGDPDLILGREDPLEKAVATHSSTLAWKIPWTEECGGLQSMG